jgi:hypothetical protein
VWYANGVDYADWILRGYLGMSLSSVQQVSPTGYSIRYCIMSKDNGVFDELIIDETLQENIVERHIWADRGDTIENCSVYKAGILFLKFDSSREMNQFVEKHDTMVVVKVRS